LHPQVPRTTMSLEWGGDPRTHPGELLLDQGSLRDGDHPLSSGQASEGVHALTQAHQGWGVASSLRQAVKADSLSLCDLWNVPSPFSKQTITPPSPRPRHWDAFPALGQIWPSRKKNGSSFSVTLPCFNTTCGTKQPDL
jgi:hypothetical protein